MAAIEKIRKHSRLLIVIIGVALLAFVLEDLFQSLGRNRENIIAVVDGDKIPYQDFANQVDKTLENYKSNGTNVNSGQAIAVRNNVLEQMIQDNIMTKEYEATGINVTADELYDQFTGENPHQWVAQTFPANDGGVDREMINNYLSNLNNLPMEYRSRWADFERSVKQDRLQNKYNNLLKASYFVPAKLAQKYYENKNTKASADVVALRYTTIADSTVVVSNKDTKAFYEENKYRYETDERRDIEYIVYEVKPSLEDRQDALASVLDMKAEFESVQNVVNFVNANSDKHYDSTWVGRKDVAQQIENAIFEEGNEVGFVFGPFEDEDAFNLVRIVDLQSRPDSLRASHILISYQGAVNSNATITKEEAKAKADSLLTVLRASSRKEDLFAELAKQFSTCPSKEKGGDLEWFTDGAMVTPFNEYVINNPVGSMDEVETVFGYHIVKVTDKTEAQPKARLAYLQHQITSSTATYQNVLAQASKFAAENKTLEQFNAAIEEQGLTKRSMPRMTTATYQITGIENPREIVRWAFDEKTRLNDVNSFFDLDNVFVIAALTSIVEEGYAPMNIVADQAKFQILNKVKGQMAVDKMKACGDDVNRMVSELGAESTTVSDITIDSRVLGNFGVEADVIGTMLGMKEGEQVGPIAGNSSAFIIKNVKINAPEATDDYSSVLREKVSQFNNKVLSGTPYNALRNKIKVSDERQRFY